MAVGFAEDSVEASRRVDSCRSVTSPTFIELVLSLVLIVLCSRVAVTYSVNAVE